ncbi:DMT family transporter [Thalassobaculum sp. OXR-137]|uniref:DMT family transporter n=1 Tax=Thalassobaculum sp. OXR-137 TaxID=3100173 RepID=UPI002AC9CD2E|nr:DMT family transporter [Thalassobaculum sp. OXR-137]WPZ35638.1 DMT family transporter [Thalassobaculum sp. OXR-137]
MTEPTAVPVTDPTPPSAPQDRVLLGIGLMLLSVALLPIMEGLAKSMSDRYVVVQLVFARFAFQSLFIVPIAALRHGRELRRGNRLALQIARGLSILAGTGFFYWSLRTLPLADGLALMFVAPLIVTAISALFLGEQVGARRWAAVLVGFLGVLVILRPGLGVFQPGAVLALAAGCCIATYALLTRHLSTAAPPLVTLAYTSLVGALCTAILLPFVWNTPDAGDWLRMAVMGSVGAFGHYFMIRAFEQAPASVISPFIYAEIVMATTIGYLWFGDFPDAFTWTGIAILIASGVYLSWREHVAQRRARIPVSGM